jgi:hypothetical protein
MSRKRKETIAASGANTEEHFKKVEAVNFGTTFRKQAERWLKHVQTRNRKPIAPSTAASWESCLDVWLNGCGGFVCQINQQLRAGCENGRGVRP